MRKLLILVIGCLLMSASVSAQNPVRKETFTFALKDSDTLRLDKYDIPAAMARPCMIFMFGGGFVGGQRDAKQYVDFFEFMAGEGFVVVSIDYRLGFKKFNDAGRVNDKTKAGEFLSMFEQTIYMAVEDLFDATNYVLANADEWNIDTGLIVTAGSSAGAISVLQGEYERCNRTALAAVLPPEFRYAGVVSFAGAVYSNKGHLRWAGDPAPVQLFHGDADKNVPYGKIKFGKYGFFGSQYIAKKYDKNGFPYYFYMEENANHRLAGSPMTSERGEIMSFLDEYVLGKQPLKTNTVMVDSRVPKVNKKKFGLKTYVRANFN